MEETTKQWSRVTALHRELKLKVEGQLVCHGQWQTLMRIVLKYADKDWEIVETFSMGERIVTKHRSLLTKDPSFLVKENNKKNGSVM